MVQLLKGLAFCRNSVVSRKFAGERARDAVAKLCAQTTVVELLKATLKAEIDTLSVVRAFSLKSTAVYDSSSVRPADDHAIRVDAWRAMMEKKAAKSKVFFSRDKQAMSAAVGAASANDDVDVANPEAWSMLIRKQFDYFKINHRLGNANVISVANWRQGVFLHILNLVQAVEDVTTKIVEERVLVIRLVKSHAIIL